MLALFVAGCSSSDSPVSNGTTDNTPPTIASVTAVDQGHVDVVFSEGVNKDSAERTDHYQLVTTLLVVGSSPVAEIGINSASRDDDQKTVHLTTDSPMQNVSYDLHVTGVQDLHGNLIAEGAMSSFTGSTAQDVTPPTVVDRDPAPGATGVGVGQAVMVQFSEGMDYSSVLSAFSWTRAGGTVSWDVQTDNGNVFTFQSTSPLLNSTQYTVTIGTGAHDYAGNPLAQTSWSFTTTSQIDHTPPTLVSSSPANNATNVNVASNISMTFSEAINQSSLQNVYLFPDIGDGVPTWSNGGKTITFDPYNDMEANTQYSLLIIPGGITDLAGNGNTSAINIVWTTGSTLATGGFSGTLSGPNSADATGPGGALVIAATMNPFATSGDFPIAGSTVAAPSGNYSIQHLAAGVYYPISVLDSNGDGLIDPDLGDAIGAYGVDFGTQDFSIDSVTVGTTVVTGISFPLFDPATIAGRINYTGSVYNSCCYPVLIGAFDTNGFDINNLGDPLYTTQANWPDYPEYRLSEFDGNLSDGSYYVGAFLDANYNSQPDPGEPMAFYGGTTPTAVVVANGTDALHIDITLTDAAPGFVVRSWNVTAPAPPTQRQAALRRIADAMRAAGR